MSDYAQPDFYRFNEDSISLINFVKSYIKDAKAILDLGAGSGIIGIEIANSLKASKLTLVEYQADFMPYLHQNIKDFLTPGISANVLQESFGTFISSEKFDLIVSNPPYYLKGEGEASKDPRRGLARSFQHEGWGELLSAIQCALAPSGKAFIVVKDHPRIRSEVQKSLNELLLLIHEKNKILILELSRLDKNGSKNFF